MARLLLGVPQGSLGVSAARRLLGVSQGSLGVSVAHRLLGVSQWSRGVSMTRRLLGVSQGSSEYRGGCSGVLAGFAKVSKWAVCSATAEGVVDLLPAGRPSAGRAGPGWARQESPGPAVDPIRRTGLPRKTTALEFVPGVFFCLFFFSSVLCPWGAGEISAEADGSTWCARGQERSVLDCSLHSPAPRIPS